MGQKESVYQRHVTLQCRIVNNHRPLVFSPWLLSPAGGSAACSVFIAVVLYCPAQRGMRWFPADVVPIGDRRQRVLDDGGRSFIETLIFPTDVNELDPVFRFHIDALYVAPSHAIK